MAVRNSQSRALLWLCLVLAGGPLCALVCGCAEGPLAKYGSLNPWAKKKWDQEDLEYGPSFQTRIARLHAIRARAKYLDESECERISTDLVPLLQNEPNLALRREMMLTLGQIPTEAASAALRQALADSDPEMRVAACEAWKLKGGHEAVEQLAGVVGSDTSVDVRIAATRALAGFREPGAVRALSLALEDSNPAMQYQAVKSLRSVSGQDFGGDVAAWRQYAQSVAPSPSGSEASMAERPNSVSPRQ